MASPPLLTEAEVAARVRDALAAEDLDGARVTLVVPDATRSAPHATMVRLLHEVLAGRVARLDVLVALGTHPPMDESALDRLLGVPPGCRAAALPGLTVHQHAWHRDDTFTDLGTIPASEVAEISGGRLARDVPVRVNRLAAEADVVLVCGPVFPHEVVGFSGGNKYLFPGVSGPEVIDVSHWLGALLGSAEIIGVPGTTPVRRLVDAAAARVPARRRCLAYVVAPGTSGATGEPRLHGLFAGTPEVAWEAAASLSAQVHVRYHPRAYATVLSVLPERYDDLWTAAKGMYKVEPVVADGGEVVLYAPHVTRVSATHGHLLAEVGYRTVAYLRAHEDRYAHLPGAVLAHSTHLRGAGTVDPVTGEDRPRVRVTLATGIDEATCRAHGLGHRDPADVDPAAVDPRSWAGDDVLVVPDAGEVLHRRG